MGQDGSGPEFHGNFGSGRVGSLHLWVGMGRVKKIGLTCAIRYVGMQSNSHQLYSSLQLFILCSKSDGQIQITVTTTCSQN